MATTLQRQLSALAAPSSALLIADRRRSSIIFTPQEAAGYNRDTFYHIGLEGLRELIGINAGLFLKFETSMLFNEESKDFERIVEDKETNNKLDEEIEEFCIAVSPYFMLKAALKSLEWLVYRFHIEKFNIPTVLECILPYYDTKTFTLVIQILEIERFKTPANKQWHWLIASVESRLPVSKTVMFSNGNPQFVSWLFATLEKFLTVHAIHERNIRVFVSFMTSTIVGILNRVLNDNSKKKAHNRFGDIAVLESFWVQVSRLLTSMNKGTLVVKSVTEIHSMIYVITSMLALVLQQKPELDTGRGNLIGKMTLALLKNHPGSLKSQTYLLLNILVTHCSKTLKLKPKTLARVLDDLSQLSDKWDLYNLSSRVILDNVAEEESGLKPSKIWKLVNEFEFSPKQRSQLLRNIYQALRESKKYSTKKWTKDFVTTFERQYPIEFDLACQDDPQFASGLVNYKKGENMIQLVQHSDKIIRARAVKKLLKRFKQKFITSDQISPKGKNKNLKNKSPKISTGKKGVVKPAAELKKVVPDTNPTAQALLPRFSDDDPDVVMILLKQKLKVLTKLFQLSTLTDLLINIIQNPPNFSCLSMALKNLCSVAKKADKKCTVEQNTELKQKIFTTLLPFLFPKKAGKVMKLVNVILESAYAAEDAFLKQYATVTSKDGYTAEEITKFSYEALTTGNEISAIWKSNPSSVKGIVFSILALNSAADVGKLIGTADSLQVGTTGIYPITKDNFANCITLADKKHKLSLELVFSTILRLKVSDFPTVARMIKFVWKASEVIENRGLCVKFLQEFMNETFTCAEERIDFWCRLILELYKETLTTEIEFYLIRAFQFLHSNLLEFPTAVAGYIMKEKMAKRVAATRNSLAEVRVSEIDIEESLLEIILIVGIYHNSHRVRKFGLSSLTTISENSKLDGTVAGFLRNILSFEEEIIADKARLPVIISESLSEKIYQPIHDRFVDKVVDKNTNQIIAVGLLKLCKLANEQIFNRFLPLALELLKTAPNSGVLSAILDCYDGSLKDSLPVVVEALQHKETCDRILSKLTREVFDRYDQASKRKLFGIMLASVLNCELPEIKVGVQRCVRKWTLDAVIVCEELDKCILMQKQQASLASGAPNTMVARRDSLKTGNISKFVESGDWANRTEVVLELIQSKKKLTDKTKLILPLFKLLKVCIALEEQSPVEYLKQLILTSLTLCCYDENKDQGSNDDWIHFNVETVIDCLRCSRNPQTHHHALILLNYAAKLYPEQVLHGVMSLFTFMGNSILRQDDAYSTQLIQQTVTTVIPTFVNTNVLLQYSTSRVSAGIYFAFTSAVQDIPVHRRLPVFTSLVETLNPTESTWQLCVIIIDKALTRDKKRSNLNADMDLAIDIVWSFGPEVVLSTVEKVYTYLTELEIYEKGLTEEDFKLKRLSQSAASKAVMDLSRKDSLRDVEIVVYYTLELVMKICTKFADLEEEKLNYDTLLEKCLSFARIVSNIHDDKIFRLITQRNLDVIDKVNAALEPTDLVRVVISILGREDLSVKKKMLDMLNQRIVHKLEWFGNLKILLELLEPLVEFGQCDPDSEELVTVIQTAFISLKLISKHLAAAHPDNFVPVFELAFGHTTHKNRLLCASAFVCLGELFCLKSLILPNLDEVFHAISKAFKASAKLNKKGMKVLNSQDDDEMEMETSVNAEKRHNAEISVNVANLLSISAVSCMTKLTEQLGPFVGASFLQKSLVDVFTLDGIFGQGEKASNRKKVFDQKVKFLLKSIGSKIPLRNSLPSIRRVFKDLIEKDEFNHSKSVVLLLDVLRETLVSTAKEDFTTLLPNLCEAFLDDFLMYREEVTKLKNEGQNVQVSGEEIDQVEDSIIGCLITGMVLKMSEGYFRPFYHKIFDWAGESVERLITFYRLSGTAAERLKSLFVTFAGYVINKATDTLAMDVHLTQAILKYFYQIFSNDREGFITLDRFNALVKPLVKLIESEYTISGEIKIQDVNNTLIQLAVATNDLNRWQHLIELISLTTQHENAKVRLFVVSTLEAAANELGKDFLPLLPPAVPFLAELLNDEDPVVEKETKKMMVKLENIVGEPLQPYFQV